MAVDLQVCFPQEVIALSQVRYLPGPWPRTLDVLGDDFRRVDEVRINGVASSEVVLVSERRLLAQVPEVLAQVPLTSVTVTSTTLALTAKSLLTFQLHRTPSKVSGLLRLVQLFLKLLFTTPGTDIFAPKLGGAALRHVGLTFGKDQGGQIVSDLIVAVRTTVRQVVALQARDPRLPREERLLDAKVLEAGYNRVETALVVGLELLSHAGQRATANVAL